MAGEKTRIAMVISGAVSLGSYQAGVIYELFTLRNKLGDRADFEVDVLAGASAGSVNSVIFALASLYDPSLIEYARKIWLEGLDMNNLLKPPADPQRSLLSSQVIDDLRRELMEKVRLADAAMPSHLPRQVGVSLTLTNLSGIPYSVQFKNKARDYQLTTFADYYTLQLESNRKDPAVLTEIEKMIEVATVSGAFPFAFPARKLKRRWQDYGHTAIPESAATEGELEFVYVDGGIFNNEPINRAREMVDRLTAADPSGMAGERIYLLVSPVSPEPEAPFDRLDMLGVGGRLVPAILKEAHFRDWYAATKVNQRLAWQDDLLGDMRSAFSRLDDKALGEVNQALSRTAGRIADFKSGKAGTRDGQQRYLNENLQRIKARWGASERSGAASDPQALQKVEEPLANLAFILECVGSLRAKRTLDIRLLSPEEQGMLAGDFFANFGGFFERKYRQHDFNIGRSVARQFVSSPRENGGLGLDLSGLGLEEINFDPSLNQVTLQDVSQPQKTALRDSVVERVGTVVAAVLNKLGLPLVGCLVRFIKTKLKDFLTGWLKIGNQGQGPGGNFS